MTIETKDINDALSANYIGVEVSLKKWSARKSDKSLASSLAQQHNAGEDAVNVSKSIMSGANSELKAVEKAMSRVRTYIYSVSLPFSSADEDSAKRGMRIIPAASSIEIMTELKNLQAEFRQEMQNFKNVYTHRVQQALANQGDLADPSLYPDVSELDSMFIVKVDFTSLPDVNSFKRINIPAELATALGNRMATRQATVIQNAQADFNTRLAEAASRAIAQMNKLISGEGARIHQSLFDEFGKLGGLLKGGIVDDPALNKLTTVMDELSNIKTIAVRDSIGLASQVKAHAEALQSAVSCGTASSNEPAPVVHSQPVPVSEPVEQDFAYDEYLY